MFLGIGLPNIVQPKNPSIFSDRLVGIYKTHNATKSVTINPEKIVQD
jgi:hypothetical protein